jgi:signal transduction histidine kinase
MALVIYMPIDRRIGLTVLLVPYVFWFVALVIDRPSTPHAAEAFGNLLNTLLMQTFLGYIFVSTEGSHERSLTQALHAASESSAIKSRFIQWLSHDLRAPLSGLSGFLELLADTGLTATQNDCVSKSLMCARSITDLISNLLDFSTIEAGRMQMARKLFQPANVFTFLHDLLVQLADEKQIEVNFVVHWQQQQQQQQQHRESSGDNNNNSGNRKKIQQQLTKTDTRWLSLFTWGDWLRLEQVVVNLATNAINYSPRGSKIWIDIDAREVAANSPAWVTLPVSDSVDSQSPSITSGDIASASSSATAATSPSPQPRSQLQLSISVKDSGAGISDEQQRFLWTPIFQVEGERRSVGVGSGLGLFIVAEVVRAFGGTVSYSNNDGGSVFRAERLCFDVASADEVALDQRQRPVTHAWTPKLRSRVHVLLVEDNRLNQTIYRRILESSLFRLTIADDGQAAIERWQQDPSISIILMDIQMPIKDGLAATRAIRELERLNPSRRRTPIVALTATNNAEELAAALRSGMNDCLIKPTKPELLEETIWR